MADASKVFESDNREAAHAELARLIAEFGEFYSCREYNNEPFPYQDWTE